MVFIIKQTLCEIFQQRIKNIFKVGCQFLLKEAEASKNLTTELNMQNTLL